MDINEETLDHYLEKLSLTQTLRQYLLLCLSKKKKKGKENWFLYLKKYFLESISIVYLVCLFRPIKMKFYCVEYVLMSKQTSRKVDKHKWELF